jgi:hypothetical protein
MVEKTTAQAVERMGIHFPFDDTVFSSPLVESAVPSSGGVLRRASQAASQNRPPSRT